MQIKDKKVLIISHNPLSCVNNNGKTLVSIFEGIPKDNIYQIFLSADIPDYSEQCHYLQINEKQIISSVLSAKNVCCREVVPTPGVVSSAKIKKLNWGNHTKRLLRECVWLIPLWKSALLRWLEDKHFDVVFLMAGDGLFAYDVYRFVMKHVSAKGCLFFTDDYIIGKTSYLPAALFRQALLKKKMKATLSITKELYVISDEMKNAYKALFHVDSLVIRNFSVEKVKTDNGKQGEKTDHLTMIYAGGLHYNRWKVLAQIAKALQEINKFSSVKCHLNIYSSQHISQDIIDQMSIEGVSAFLGGVAASEIAGVYAKADILLHVESFEKKAIASTKYSFSTKIPEYLSAEKCVLAVGPDEVASIQYLSNVACVVTDSADLVPVLTKLINHAEYRNTVMSNCAAHFEADFSRERQRELLQHIVSP